MGFRDWLTGKKKENEKPDEMEKYYKAIRMTLRDYNINVSPKESPDELERLYTQAMRMYGASRVNQTFEGYKKKLGLKG